ncbi:pentapeptide repeat-containing protein [Streptomyces sp. NPDC059037]|uniref:pentapeptide repeat-containing protein n=1 Tax=Streptomyces sp. NPDC059037 TaxID=3346710 RepID=UPI00369AE2AA
MAPGADIDHSGTPFTESLLGDLLRALTEPRTGQPRLGTAQFDEAVFSGDAWFRRARFSGAAGFVRATFKGVAEFDQARFQGAAKFDRACFTRRAEFDKATFEHEALFDRVLFGDTAVFRGAKVGGIAGFEEVKFIGDAWFRGAEFSGAATFCRTIFEITAGFEQTKFTGAIAFDDAKFRGDAWFGGHAAFKSDARFRQAEFAGAAGFDHATFIGTVGFDGAVFTGPAIFRGAKLFGAARFQGVTFSDDASFDNVTFERDVSIAATFCRAGFAGARFHGIAEFSKATFSGAATFSRATFSRDSRFNEAVFADSARFDQAVFVGNASFREAEFTQLPHFGPLTCRREVDLSGAVFGTPVTMEIAATVVRCVRTQWEEKATLRLRYATLDLSDALLSFSVAITAHPTPFATGSASFIKEDLLAGNSDVVRIASVRSVDAAHLVLTNVDLRACLFSGALHLDQLRLEGHCVFPTAPSGFRRRVLPQRWTRRRTLAEEHHWRALTDSNRSSPHGWHPGPHHPDAELTPTPSVLAATYRQLRKAFEDGKDEPGAADFYYGEMEMRRHDRDPAHGGTPVGERGLLWVYWLLSGYGLRASRALAWLIAAMASTVLLLMLWGLPSDSPKPESSGTVKGEQIHLTTDTPAPANPTGPLSERLTGERWEKGVRVVINSVVFRSSGQDLTTVGTYTEMASRMAEPVLLGLAVLAARGRIKR